MKHVHSIILIFIGPMLNKARDLFLKANQTGLKVTANWVTKAVSLPARFVIFTCSPGLTFDTWRKMHSNVAKELIKTYVNVFETCNSQYLHRVAVPLFGIHLIYFWFPFQQRNY